MSPTAATTQELLFDLCFVVAVAQAGAIMVSIFVSFMFIDRIELKQVGLGLTVAVLFDAVVLRILILPATMTLLGERCWWPSGSAHQAPAELGRVELAAAARSRDA